ncbi:MAG: hypothetical protein WAZ27_00440 [Minisyncoccia bacterium]
MQNTHWLRRAAPITVFVPFTASAQALGEELSSLTIIFYGVVGVFGAVSVVFFIVGLITYFTRLGTERREEGILTMEKGFSVMAVVIFAIVILRYLEG